MKEELIQETIIYNYINRTKLADARRATYYEKGITIPKKYQTLQYEFRKHNSKTVIFDRKTNLPVIKNTKTAGQPRYTNIRGNSFYSGFAHNSVRIAIVESIKGDFLKYFNKLKQFKLTDYPIHVKFVYFDHYNAVTSGKKGSKKNKSQDLDNLDMPYKKCSLDLLKKLGKIVDDELKFIRKLSCEFIPIKSTEDRRLYIRFFSYKPGYIFNETTKEIEICQ